MIMTLKEANKTLESLNLLGSLHLPTQLAFIVAKNRKTLINELAIADEQKEALIKEYADKGAVEINQDTGELNFIDTKEKEEFLKRHNELYGVKTEIDVKTVKYEEIEKCEQEAYDNLSVDCINALLFMLED